MKPTVTIDLHEYEQLAKLRDCLSQRQLYVVYKSRYGMDMYVYVKDEATKEIAEEMQQLRKDRDHWYDQYIRLTRPITTKKWYQFWK